MSKEPTNHSRPLRIALRSTARTRALTVIPVLAGLSLLLLAGASFAASSQQHATRAAASPALGLGYVPGQILVKFREGVGPARRSATKAVAGVDKTLERLGPEGRKNISLVQLEEGVSVERAIAQLRGSGAVIAAEPNYIRQATGIPPNDPFFANQWGLVNSGQTIDGVAGTVDADIGAEVAWWWSEKGDSNPVTVAVIDTGIDQNHPDLVNSLWRNPGEIAGNGIDDDANGYVDDVIGYNMAGISQRHINAIWTIGNTDTNWKGQSILGTGGPLTQVGLYIGAVGAPTASIELVVRDSSNASNLASATIAPGAVGTTAGVVNATLSSSITLTAGQTYYILVRTTAADAANHYQVYGNSFEQDDYKADPYKGGAQRSWNGTAWTVAAADDWFFTTNANSNPQDDNGHGTHVSGIIAAGIDNGVGIAGVSYGARIMTIKAGSSNGSFTSGDIIKALTYAADNGAKIINMSFGGTTTSSLEQDAVLYAYGKGAALFAAAGNHLFGEDATTFNFPASYWGVVSVAATTNLDARAGFSNVNATVDVSAPGDSIYSTMPTYAVALNSEGAAQDYDYLSGTSMASPMVAGLAALVLSRNPEYTAAQVMDVIETRLVDDKGPIPGWDPAFGTGRITGVNLAREVSVGNNRLDGGWYMPSSPFSQTLDSGGDRNDIFSVNVVAGQHIQVRMTVPSAADFDLYLYPPGTTDAAVSSGVGGAVASSVGGANPEWLSYVVPADGGGTYYLRANAKSGRGSYTVYYDDDNTIPGTLIPASPIDNSLYSPDDDDVFRVSLAAGEKMLADLTGAAGTAFDLYLYPPGSTDFWSSGPVASSAGGSYPRKIKYVVPAGAGGTYYLRATRPGSSSSGAYALTYSIEPPDVTPPITAMSISPALPDGDNGWYKTTPTITLASNEAGVTYIAWGPIWSGGWWTYLGPFGAYEGARDLHYYSVDEVGNAEVVQDHLVKLDMSAPSAPTLLSASGVSSTAVSLSWAAATDLVSGVSGYRVYNADSGVLLGSPSASPYQLNNVTPGVQNRYYVTAVDNAGNESGHSNTTAIATLAAGSDVPVTVDEVTLSFSSISSGGGVTVTTSTAPPPTQTGFEVNGVYYDVSTTAVYSGFITVTLPYDPATAGDPQALRLYHFDTTVSSWVDVTTGVDTTNHTISGRVTSFSWFAAGPPRQVFGGFRRPIDPDGTSVFKRGHSLPVKFRLTDARRHPVANAVARIFVAKLANGVPGVEKPGTSTSAKSGNTFRYSHDDHEYIFNLDTKGLSPGVWRIRVLLDDGLSYVVSVSLK